MGCTGAPFPISVSWIQLFIEKNAAYNVLSMNHSQFSTILRQSQNQYASIISTADPDLTDFKTAGGKMITWHGLADQLIFPNGTFDYYNRVLAEDSAAGDYYRGFAAPGVAHCAGEVGYYHSESLQVLVEWVEKDIAPETLVGTTLPDVSGVVRKAPLCQYPMLAKYIGGDVNVASSFKCGGSF